MKLQTTIEIPKKELTLNYKDSILCMGSCFADEIGRRLTDCYFDTMVNPFGVLFNPMSISNALGLMEGYGINSYGCSFVESDVIKTPAGYCSFHHHGSFAKESPEAFLSNANEKLAYSSDFFYRQGWVIITLGTAYVYREKENGMVVSNCHKLPASQFNRSLLTVEEVVNALSQYVNANPDRQWVFTVSPIRHIADGLHQNQISKSTLLLAIQQIVEKYPNAHYFPSYEIVLDELRDYRFYAEDMVHPSKQAVDYIFERFIDWALADNEKNTFHQAVKLRQMMEHKIMNPESEQAKGFVQDRERLYNNLMKEIGRI